MIQKRHLAYTHAFMHIENHTRTTFSLYTHAFMHIENDTKKTFSRIHMNSCT